MRLLKETITMIEKQSNTNNSKVHAHNGSEKSHSHTHSHTQTKAVLNRLSRAIGHLTAVRNMVENGRDCSEVLIQLAAVRSAVNKTSEVILKDHLDHCIIHAAEKGDMKAIKELNRAIELFMK